jgi:hypothetical protein
MTPGITIGETLFIERGINLSPEKIPIIIIIIISICTEQLIALNTVISFLMGSIHRILNVFPSSIAANFLLYIIRTVTV